MTAEFGFTWGASHTQANWGDARHLSWPQMVQMLTSHVPGAKEGSCVVPAVFTGDHRKKDEAARIDVAFLDSDSGATLDDIRTALMEKGWEAVVSSTHSHMTTDTKVSLVNWNRYFSKFPQATPTQFLIEEKGYLPHVAADAEALTSDDTYVFLHHQPCPKFRIVLPLARPWIATSYPTQAGANAVWKERIEALAAALSLSHDQACTDTSRLFYLPRRPPHGAVPQTAVTEGAFCDIFALPKVNGHANGYTNGHTLFDQPKRVNGHAYSDSGKLEYADPITGEFVDLADWAKATGRTFLIAGALKAKRPGVFTGLITDNCKVHIDCPNAGSHTDPGRDDATFVINAGRAASEGFVIHCRHGHCTGKDRLFFVRRMLEEQWLTIGDLTAEEFQLKEPRKSPEPETEPPVEPKSEAKKPELLWSITEPWEAIEIPKRPWLAKGYLLRGAITVVSGPGSAGKSSLMVAWGVTGAIGSGINRMTPVHQLRIATYNVEDDADEQKRRFSGMMQRLKLEPGAIGDRLAILGPKEVGTLLHIPRDGSLLVNTPVMDNLESFVLKFRPDVLILDPFVELHSVEENDNTAIRAVMARLRSMAVAYKMAVVVLHHSRKGNGDPGDPDTLRGASSIVGAARVVLTLNTMSEAEAEAMNIPKDKRRNYFRLDGAKNNYAPIEEAEWFERQEMALPNGDGVAVAWPWHPPSPLATASSQDLNKALDRIAEGCQPGIPYSASKQGDSDRWAGQVLRSMIGSNELQAKNLIKQWLANGTLVEINFHHPKRRQPAKGVQVNDAKRPS